MEIGAGNF